MANPIIPGIPQTEQDLLYSKLNAYNQGRASYKEVGAYLVVLPRPEHPQYTLWVYSPLPGRQSIFYICDLSTDIHETLRMASTLCFYSPRSLLLVEYNAKKNAEQRGRHYLHRQIPRPLPARNSPYRPCLSHVDSLQIPASHPQTGTFRTDCQDLPFGLPRHTTKKNVPNQRRTFSGEGRGKSGEPDTDRTQRTTGRQPLQDTAQRNHSLFLRTPSVETERLRRQLRQHPDERTHGQAGNHANCLPWNMPTK